MLFSEKKRRRRPVPPSPSNKSSLQETLKVLGGGIAKGPKLVALAYELEPAEPVGADSAEGDGLTDYYQPLPGSSHCRVEELCEGGRGES